MTDSKKPRPFIAGQSLRAIPVIGRLRQVAPNGMAARIFLAFLTTAGLFYVNIMPAIVDGLVEGLGFSSQKAGQIGSANTYGAAVGAFLIVLFVQRIRWRPVALRLLVVLIAIDLLSMLVSDFSIFLPARFLHGLVGGAIVGIGFAVIARTLEPDRTFGVLLFVQFGLGGLGVMVIPPLVPVLGTWILFVALISFSLVTLLMVPFLSDYPLPMPLSVEDTSGQTMHETPIRYFPLLLTLLAIFLFQAANMGLYAYIIGLGRSYGLTTEFISPTLGAAAWIAMAGSALVIILSTKYGRTLPLTAGILLTVLGTWALHFSALPWVYWVANAGVGITWAFVIPYLLGLSAAFDETGQMAAFGGFSSKMGLASGPLAASFLIQTDNYAPLINVGIAALLLCCFLALFPALTLDREKGISA